jgi:GT2 family glycosyltransferase
MNQPSVKLAILIATKDRIDELRNLLESINQSTLLPDKIVIVYSGEDISSLIGHYQKSLNIQIIYSPIASQSVQKSLGIKSLSEDYTWVLFLDDDLVLELNTIKILFDEYLINPKFDGYAGFGLGISNRSTRKLNIVVTRCLKFFRLFSDTPGTITKSGHAQSYLDHGTEVDVQWLNGVSAWNSKVLFNYLSNQASISYSAYEDVEFSYKVGKNNKMLFVPMAKVRNQNIEGNSPLTVSQYVYGGYLRYRFVFNNRELSKSWLLTAQFIRGLDFIMRPNKESKIASRIKVALNLWLCLLTLALRNKNSAEVLHDDKVENIK